MPTIVLKDIPGEVYVRLRDSARRNRRSISDEAVACLKAVLMPRRLTSDEHIAKAREIRASLGEARFPASAIETTKRQGRLG